MSDGNMQQPLNPEAWSAMSDADLVFAIVNYMRAKVSFEGFRSYFDWLNGLQRLPKGMLLLQHVFKLDCEVNNGGFDQYFLNTDGRLIRETLKSLEQINATEQAELLREAAGIYGPDSSRARLHELDSQYLECEAGILTPCYLYS